MSAAAVSVVLPVRGGDPVYLRESVTSILHQSLQELELIVVEDPSDRPAAPVLGEFNDRRLKHIVTREPRGLGAALNLGLAEARAPLVARMDADDVAEPWRLEVQLRALQDEPSLGLIGSRIQIIDHDGRPIGHRRYPLEHDAIVSALRRYNCFSHPSVVFRRDLVLAHGGYREGIWHEDYDLWCRLALAGVRMANRPEWLIRYRFHPAALKLEGVHRGVRETIELKKRYFGGRLGVRERGRLLAEGVLTRLPPGLVVRLFTALEYHRRPHLTR